MGEWGVKILDFRFWIKELKFNPKDALLPDAQGTRTCSKRTPALKPATRSVSKSCHAAGFTLRYRQFHYPKLNCPMPHAKSLAIVEVQC